MRKSVTLFLLFSASLFAADPSAPSEYVTTAEVQAAIQAMDPARPAVNTLLKTVDEGEYTVSIVVVRRIPEPGVEDVGQSHDRITEVYQIVSGTGVMETGGSMVDTSAVDLKPAIGPTLRGRIVGGKTRPIAPGDIIVMLPHVPHRFSHVDGTIAYIAMRIEAKRR